MQVRVALALAAAALVTVVTGASADPTGHYTYVAPVAGFTVFDGTMRVPSAPLKDGAYWGARAGWQWLPWLAVEASGGATSTHENAPLGAKVTYWHAAGDLAWMPWRGPVGNPFVSLGFGTARFHSADPNVRFSNFLDAPGDLTQGGIEGALGWTAWISDRWGVRVEGRDFAWLPKEKITVVRTHTMMMSAGVTLAFGAKSRDTDGDGVRDRDDQCPLTPHGAVVDARGCPKDADSDGVLDGLDQCAATPTGARVDVKGCPTDADGDGVPDGLDDCADTPKGATVDAKGCTSDSDGDGVLDGLDQCPDTPKGAKIDAHGCPIDSDGDGVPDGLDRCPDTAGGVKVDSLGCPVGQKEREQELLDTGRIRLQNVQFQTGKADLLPESLPVLDAVGDLLMRWPALQIEISGHTDSKGKPAANLKLSQARADAVRTYLLQRFPKLSPAQFTAKGYGATRPVVPNDTEAGRAVNRRVEFLVLNRGVLQQEIEKRSKPAAAPSDSTQAPGSN